jgi:hypothetical protein
VAPQLEQLAVKVSPLPLQIVEEEAVTLTAGIALIVTEVVTGIAAHPPEEGIV